MAEKRRDQGHYNFLDQMRQGGSAFTQEITDLYDARRKALGRAAQRGTGGGAVQGDTSYGGGDLQNYAYGQLANRYGISDEAERSALFKLWQRESSWNPNAVNASSGAWGIAQTLPSAHPNVRRNNNGRAQIDWGLDYIMKRYGRPSSAWNHSERTNWY